MSPLTLEQYQAEELRLASREGRQGLRIHAAVSTVVVVALAVVSGLVASEFPWSVFPAFGMGLGVWFHW